MKKLIQEDWLSGFLEATAHTVSPDAFRLWAGIACLAGALERRRWVRTAGSALYPNLYIFLVAPPGVGKTQMTDRVRAIWRTQDDIHVAADNLSRAALTDELDEARVLLPQHHADYNSLAVASNELGVLISAYDAEFLSSLTDLYDGNRFRERKRTKRLTINIDRPQINLIAACTPKFLGSLLPETAWDQGFMSRVIMVYSGEHKLIDLFNEGPSEEVAALGAGLADRRKAYGRLDFTSEASAFLQRWHMRHGPPIPAHPKLLNYNSRRTAHLIKLSIIATVSANLPQITPDAIRRAQQWLFDAEADMPEVFKAASAGGDANTLEECVYFVYEKYIRSNTPIPERDIIGFLSTRVDAFKVQSIYDLMVRSGRLIRDQEKGPPTYRPGDIQCD